MVYRKFVSARSGVIRALLLVALLAGPLTLLASDPAEAGPAETTCEIGVDCQDSNLGVSISCTADSQECVFGTTNSCSTATDCYVSISTDCADTTCDYSLDANICGEICELGTTAECEQDCKAAFVDDCSTTCDQGIQLTCEDTLCDAQIVPDCNDCAAGFITSDPPSGAAFYLADRPVEFVPDPGSPNFRLQEALDVIGLGSEADDIAASARQVGPGIRFADDTNPTTNPATTSRGELLEVAPFEVTLCQGDGCAPLPTCGEILCSGEGPEAGATYRATYLRYTIAPDPVVDFMQVSSIYQVGDAQSHIPIEQYPGDGYGGSSVQFGAQRTAEGFFLARSTTANGFVSEDFNGFATANQETVVIYVRADELLPTDQILGWGISSHVHDGTFGQPADSESRFHTYPQWNADGVPRVLEAYAPFFATPPLVNRTIFTTFNPVTGQTTYIPPDPRQPGVDLTGEGNDDTLLDQIEDGTFDAGQPDEVADADIPASDDGDSSGFPILPVAAGTLIVVGVTYALVRPRTSGIGVRPPGESLGSSSRTRSPQPDLVPTLSDADFYDSSLSDEDYYDSIESSDRRSSSYYKSRNSGCSPRKASTKIWGERADPADGGPDPSTRMARLAFVARSLANPMRDRSTSPLLPRTMMISGGHLWEPGRTMDGHYLYTVNRHGRFAVIPGDHPGVTRPIHTDLLPFGKAYAAGEMLVRDGQLIAISDSSGHFRPGAAQMLNALDHLAFEAVDLANVEIRFSRKHHATGNRRRIAMPAPVFMSKRTALAASVADAHQFRRQFRLRWNAEHDTALRQILDRPLFLFGFEANPRA